MHKIIFSILFAATVLSITSCKKSFDPGTTATQNLANGWWVTLKVNGVDTFGVGTYFMNTYNTTSSMDSIWIDDLKNGYGFKSKVASSSTALTFGTTSSLNEYYVGTPSFPASVKITNGKILLKAGHSLGGNVTDSIYMQANFSDDPTTNFVIAGTARTGFIEDDY